MAVYSMTGYANASASPAPPAAAALHEPPAATASTGSIGVEMRSVNNRFLDLVVAPAGRVPQPRAGAARAGHGALQARQDRAAPHRRGRFGNRDRRAATRAAGPPRPPRAHGAAHAARRPGRCRSRRRCTGAAAGARQDDASGAVLEAAKHCIAGLAQARAREGARLAGVLGERVAQPARRSPTPPSRWCRPP